MTEEKVAAKPEIVTWRLGTDAPHMGVAGADRSPGTCHPAIGKVKGKAPE